MTDLRYVVIYPGDHNPYFIDCDNVSITGETMQFSIKPPENAEPGKSFGMTVAIVNLRHVESVQLVNTAGLEAFSKMITELAGNIMEARTDRIACSADEHGYDESNLPDPDSIPESLVSDGKRD